MDLPSTEIPKQKTGLLEEMDLEDTTVFCPEEEREREQTFFSEIKIPGNIRKEALVVPCTNSLKTSPVNQNTGKKN